MSIAQDEKPNIAAIKHGGDKRFSTRFKSAKAKAFGANPA
jgi:hypothetical protein